MDSATRDEEPVDLTIVVVSFNGAIALDRCLASLASQARQAHEIIVAPNWHDHEAQDLLANRFRQARWLPTSTRATVPQLRAAGIEASRGRVVALVEDDCTMAPTWVSAVLTAHRGPVDAVGGAVEPHPYQRGLDWAAYFCDYGRFMLPFPAGPSPDLPGNNVSYRRGALPDRPDPRGFFEVVVHRDWRTQGRRLVRDPQIVVVQHHRWSWRDVTTVPFHHGRGFAAQRFPTASRVRRAACSVFAVVVPALTTTRILRAVISRRRHVRRALQALPWIVLLLACWAAGESIGYTFGADTSLEHWR